MYPVLVPSNAADVQEPCRTFNQTEVCPEPELLLPQPASRGNQVPFLRPNVLPSNKSLDKDEDILISFDACPTPKCGLYT